MEQETKCRNCDHAPEASGCGCAVSAGHGIVHTYEVWRYEACVGWEPDVYDYEVAYVRGEPSPEEWGDAAQLTWDELKGALSRADLCRDAWRVGRSDGQEVFSAGTPYDAEHSAWLSRCPR
tara:strand:+ start:1706 stop:2068 length:363 start_codon:yes stop_codon:yes gene_type:complete